LRWVFVVLNTAMLAATPIDGSHYFVDVLAGIALAALSLLLAQVLAAATVRVPRAREVAQGVG
jgi:membrane-associated phospholipid phosphatase